MQYLMLALIVVANVLIIIDRHMDNRRIRDVEQRVNILDEVVTQHSEELDELQRHTTPGAQRLQELEEMGRNVEIKVES